MNIEVFKFNTIKENVNKVWKYILPVFFLVLLGLRIYSNIAYDISLAKREILALLLLCIVFLYKNRITWCLGICLFTYGLYRIFGTSHESGNDNTMLFTVAIDYAFPDLYSKNRIVGICIRLMQVLFYIIAFISFFTKPVRRCYGWKRESNVSD